MARAECKNLDSSVAKANNGIYLLDLVYSITYQLSKFSDCYEMFKVAVTNVITDEGFSLPCEKALRAKLCAEKLLEWMPDNQEVAANFSFTLVNNLKSCCSHPRQVTSRTHRQRMWEKYYKYSSAGLKEEWTIFLQSSIGFAACPIFYQFVTKVLLEAVIKQFFNIHLCIDETSQDVLKLGYEESNALRYTCGYVIRSLTKKLKRSGNPMKKELILCLEDMKEKAGIFVFLTLNNSACFYRC